MSKENNNVISNKDFTARRISESWKQYRQRIVAVGRKLVEARDALPADDFKAMVKSDLPFPSKVADKLIAVAEDPAKFDDTDFWEDLVEDFEQPAG